MMYFITFLLIKNLQLSEVIGFIVDFMSSSFVSHSFENEKKMSEFIVYYQKHNKYFYYSPPNLIINFLH